MSNYDRSNRVIGQPTAPVSMTTAADVGTWTIVGPITVARVGVLVTTAQTGTAPVLSFDLRPTFGSDTGRVAAEVGRVTFPAGGVALGKTVTTEVRQAVNAGQQVVCAVTTGATAGQCVPFIEWVTRTENSANQNNAQLASAGVPGPLTLPLLAPMLDAEAPVVEKPEADEADDNARVPARA